MTAEGLESELEHKITPWLEHMRWRADFEAWRYKRIWQENYQTLHIGEVCRHAGELRSARALDLGSGMGGFAVALYRASGATVIAADFNPAYGEIARLRAQRYALDLPALTAVGEALPFPDASFQVVTAWDVLEHVADPERVIAEAARVLRPGGRLFLTAINRLALRDPHYHLPGVNYVPRRLGEWLIAQSGRSKRGRAFQDKQALSEMHYFRYGALVRLAARYGLRALDLRAERSLRAARDPQRGDRRARLLRALNRVGLLGFGYRAYRTLAMGTFELALSKGQPAA